MKKILTSIIGLIILFILIGIIYPYIFCVKEGKKYENNPLFEYLYNFSLFKPKCCNDLVSKKISNPNPNNEVECMTVMCDCYICLKCGDGVCTGLENKCNCSEDCK